MNNPILGDIEVQAQIIIRLMLSYILSAIIGWERERAQRPAGLRTHILVGTGAAAYMVISIYGFEGLGTVRDPARLAAQIITGIGFLGAGAIWRSESRVGGLTTAASIWMVAAIGMMAGVGMWLAALFVTLLAWFTLRVVKVVDPISIRRTPRFKRFRSRGGLSKRGYQEGEGEIGEEDEIIS